MSRDDRVTVHQLFHGLQTELAARLTHNRAAIAHPSAKGDAAELDWKAMLAGYLPARYTVDKGFVLDSNGRISDQIDLIIYDRQYSPLLFNHAGARYVPAESVYAVFEVKQELTRGNFAYAKEKAASVRSLTRTSASIVHAGGRYDSAKVFEIQAGIVCLDSGWDPAFGRPFEETLTNSAASERINIGCALRHGGFDVTYEPTRKTHSSSSFSAFFNACSDSAPRRPSTYLNTSDFFKRSDCCGLM